ncbi:Adhesion G-protein coupled receptor G4 [Manis javanica]|nr:Adhesion G-protein coupled receptor G4 [Manis javanica]
MLHLRCLSQSRYTEKTGIATGVLVQPVGPRHQLVSFLSKQLDPTAKGWQPCLRALAAAVRLAKEALKLALLQCFLPLTPTSLPSPTLTDAQRPPLTDAPRLLPPPTGAPCQGTSSLAALQQPLLIILSPRRCTDGQQT